MDEYSNTINNLLDLKDTNKYTSCDTANFLKNNFTDFYNKHVEDFETYLKEHGKTIHKFIDDYSAFTNTNNKAVCLYFETRLIKENGRIEHFSDFKHEYSEEERKIIRDIFNRKLLLFYVYDMQLKGHTLEEQNELQLVITIKVFLDDEKTREELIDYINKQGIKNIMNNSNIKSKIPIPIVKKYKKTKVKYFKESKSIKIDDKPINFTPKTIDAILYFVGEKELTESKQYFATHKSRINKLLKEDYGIEEELIKSIKVNTKTKYMFNETCYEFISK